MELKEEYKSIKIEDIANEGIKRIVALTKEKLTVELNEKANEIADRIKEKKQEKLYIVLYLLNQNIKRRKIEIKIRIIGDFEIDAVMICLWGEMPIKQCKITDDIYGKKIIETKNVNLIKQELNNICNNWEDVFIINKGDI